MLHCKHPNAFRGPTKGPHIPGSRRVKCPQWVEPKGAAAATTTTTLKALTVQALARLSAHKGDGPKGTARAAATATTT